MTGLEALREVIAAILRRRPGTDYFYGEALTDAQLDAAMEAGLVEPISDNGMLRVTDKRLVTRRRA